MADGRRKYKRTELDGKVTNRLAVVQAFGNILFLILIGYLFCVQVLDLNDYKEKGIAIRTTDNTSVRGNIYDRNGIILATDRIFYEVYAHPDLYSEKYPPEKIAAILAPILKMPEAKLTTLLKSKKINTIVLKKDADRATAQKITKLHLRAISVGALKQRVYPQGSLASHILGYYSHRSENAVGIESIANDTLSDIGNLMHYERTVNGEVIFDFGTDVKNLITKQRGKDVTLTINSAVQYICDRELKKVIKEKNADRGAIIITDVKSGEILAYSAYPTFDPNQFWKYPQSYTKNWSLTDVYPSGSTFKVLTVATALELGAINESSKIPDTGRMVIDGHAITNYDYARRPNPGMIDLVYLFEHSSNVGSANIALMLNPSEYHAKLKDFGFGQKTGIDLTAESVGLLPDPILWYKSRRASMGYGYGASVTAIQMIAAVSAIANNGVWITPHVIKYSEKEAPLHITSRRVMTEENAKTVTKLLAQSISNGKTPLNLKKYTVAAKTGTSNKHFTRGNDVYTSAIGYLPASNPKIAIYVVVDSPRTGSDWGNTIASPVFARVTEEVGTILGIESDKR